MPETSNKYTDSEMENTADWMHGVLVEDLNRRMLQARVGHQEIGDMSYGPTAEYVRTISRALLESGAVKREWLDALSKKPA